MSNTPEQTKTPETVTIPKPVPESTTPPSSPNLPKEKQEIKDQKKEEKDPNVNIVGSESGINLIPILSDTEVKEEKKKRKVNLSAITSLIILFIISILIVGFNILFKLQLNSEKDKLSKQEVNMSVLSQKIINNNEIVDRVSLFNDIEKGRYSAKEVMEHVNDIALKADCGLISFSFTGTNGIEFNGKAQSLEDVAKFWYLLGNDTKVEKISLKSVGKGLQDISFSFFGTFVLDNFLKSSVN
ncbi:MAG: hypothetical protein AB9915_03535 [Candidatus Dojkabacteria bacterium]